MESSGTDGGTSQTGNAPTGTSAGSSTTDGTTSSSTTGTTEDSTGPEPDCVEADCPCPDGECATGLVCVDGTCTPCGNGIVEGPEQCDGDVDNGTCVACMLSCDPGFADCDMSPDNGCEADLTSQLNCGVCGRDCLGGDCTAQECQPVDLAVGQNQPLDVDVEGDSIAWTNYGFNPGEGGVWIRSLSDNTPPIELASELAFPESVVLDGTHVYYADTFGTGNVGRVNYDGSAENTDWLLADGVPGASRLLSDAVNLYAFQFLAPPVRAAKGSFQSPVDMTGDTARSGFLYEGSLYYSNPGQGQIRRVDVDLLQAPQVVVTGQPNVFAVYVHDGRIYWTRSANDETTGSVHGQGLDGSDPIEYATGLTNSEDLVVDDDHIYFVERAMDGEVWRASIDGAVVEPLAPAWSGGIDHDEDAIYWTDQVDGRIRMLAK